MMKPPLPPAAPLALLLLLLAVQARTDDRPAQAATPPPPLDKTQQKCARLPENFPFKKNLLQADYNATDESLFLDLTDLVYKFCKESVYLRNESVTFKLDLLATRRDRKVRDGEKALADCPADPAFSRDARSKLVTSVRLSPSNPVTLFRFVQGSYFLRLSECRLQACVPLSCSWVKTFTAAVPKAAAVCRQGPSEVTDLRPRDGRGFFQSRRDISYPS